MFTPLEGAGANIAYVFPLLGRVFSVELGKNNGRGADQSHGVHALLRSGSCWAVEDGFEKSLSDWTSML
jgi:hypothetical protein